MVTCATLKYPSTEGLELSEATRTQKPTSPDVTGVETILQSVVPVVKHVPTWFRKKNNTIVQAAALTILGGEVAGWWNLGHTVIYSTMAAAMIYYLAIGAMTVTANVRLTGKMWGGPDGISVDDVSEHVPNNLVILPGTEPEVKEIHSGNHV